MAATGVSARLRACVCADWEWQMADSPEYATLIGQHGEGDGRLDDLSLAAFDRRERYHCELARELSCLDTSELGAEEAITHRLLLDQVRGEAVADCQRTRSTFRWLVGRPPGCCRSRRRHPDAAGAPPRHGLSWRERGSKHTY